MEVINDATHLWGRDKNLQKALTVKSQQRKSLVVAACQKSVFKGKATYLRLAYQSNLKGYYARIQLQHQGITHYFIIKPKPGHTIFS